MYASKVMVEFSVLTLFTVSATAAQQQQQQCAHPQPAHCL
jgi:hypothetical protein